MRRTWLVLGCFGLVVSAARPVRAVTSVDVEGDVHGGTASGEWACGPTAQVKYGGLGAQGRIWLDTPPAAASGEPSLPQGFNIGVGAAGELRSYSLIECRKEPCEPQDRQLPPTGLVGAATITGAYDGDLVGVRLGALVGERYRESTDRKPTVQFVPEAHLRVGRRDRVRVEFGLGSYSTDTILRPGAYIGLGTPLTTSLDLTTRLGYHQVIDGDVGPRLDVAARWRLGSVLSATGGVGLSHSLSVSRVDPHARLGVAASF